MLSIQIAGGRHTEGLKEYLDSKHSFDIKFISSSLQLGFDDIKKRYLEVDKLILIITEETDLIQELTIINELLTGNYLYEVKEILYFIHLEKTKGMQAEDTVNKLMTRIHSRISSDTRKIVPIFQTFLEVDSWGFEEIYRKLLNHTEVDNRPNKKVGLYIEEIGNEIEKVYKPNDSDSNYKVELFSYKKLEVNSELTETIRKGDSGKSILDKEEEFLGVVNEDLPRVNFPVQEKLFEVVFCTGSAMADYSRLTAALSLSCMMGNSRVGIIDLDNGTYLSDMLRSINTKHNIISVESLLKGEGKDNEDNLCIIHNIKSNLRELFMSYFSSNSSKLNIDICIINLNLDYYSKVRSYFREHNTKTMLMTILSSRDVESLLPLFTQEFSKTMSLVIDSYSRIFSFDSLEIEDLKNMFPVRNKIVRLMLEDLDVDVDLHRKLLR